MKELKVTPVETASQGATLENCGPENVEFNRKWHLVSANRVANDGKPYARPGEYIVTANVGARYDTACYWRTESEKLESQLTQVRSELTQAKVDVGVMALQYTQKTDECIRLADRDYWKERAEAAELELTRVREELRQSEERVNELVLSELGKAQEEIKRLTELVRTLRRDAEV